MERAKIPQFFHFEDCVPIIVSFYSLGMCCLSAAIQYKTAFWQKNKNPVLVESLPSNPLKLNSPQAFVCLSCSIYTPCVWKCTHQVQKTSWTKKKKGFRGIKVWVIVSFDKKPDVRTSHICPVENITPITECCHFVCLWDTNHNQPSISTATCVIIILQPGAEKTHSS